MRPNLSISYGSNDKTQFSIPQVLNLAAGGIVRPVLLGVGNSGSICKEIIQRIGQTLVNLNYNIKIRHTTLISKDNLLATAFLFVYSVGKILILPKIKNKINQRKISPPHPHARTHTNKNQN